MGLEPYWLPYTPDFPARIKALNAAIDLAITWNELVALVDKV